MKMVVWTLECCNLKSGRCCFPLWSQGEQYLLHLIVQEVLRWYGEVMEVELLVVLL